MAFSICNGSILVVLCMSICKYGHSNEVHRRKALEEEMESNILTGILDKWTKLEENREKMNSKLLSRIRYLEKKVDNLEESNFKLQERILVLESLTPLDQKKNSLYDIVDIHKEQHGEFVKQDSNENTNSKDETHYMIQPSQAGRKSKSKDVKRLLISTNPPDIDMSTAFYAYMGSHEIKPGKHQTLIFDTVVTNIGKSYNNNSGVFTVPKMGVYIFAWTLAEWPHEYSFTEIVVNSSPFGSIHSCGSPSCGNMVTGTIALFLNIGDIVYIRTNPSADIVGKIYSGPLARSSFCGWKI